MISLNEEYTKYWMGGIQLRGDDLQDIDAYLDVEYNELNGVYKIGNWQVTSMLKDVNGVPIKIDLTPYISETTLNNIFEDYIVSNT